MKGRGRFALWLRWVCANALAELVGLGLTFAMDYLIILRFAASVGFWAPLIGIVLVTLTGTIEGSLVGLAQWMVLRHPFPRISRFSWIGATIVGAMVAWFLGSLPSTLMDLSAQGGGMVQEPPIGVVLLLAAAMGLVLGVVLSYPQWRTLRRAVEGAWIWIPAHCVAWALGMPVIFAAMDLAFGRLTLFGRVAIIAGGLLLAGALVGAVHGLALVRLTQRDASRML